jgi:hypothetical protein
MNHVKKINIFIFTLSVLSVAILATFYFSKNFFESRSFEVEKDENLFSKNKECADMKQKIESEIVNNNTAEWQEQLIEIFYAPKLDSCIYVSEVRQIGYWRILKRLVDYRSAAGSEPIDSCEYPHTILMAIIETTAKDKTLLQAIDRDRNKLDESWCNLFDAEVKRLKEF